jgi:hypothetical protein
MATGAKREMPKPAADKQPLKANVYDVGRTLVSTLTPLFPYVDEGAIVPTIALFYGDRVGGYGYFQHINTVDEIAIIFGAGGTTGRGKGGLVRLSTRDHGVGNLLTDPTSPECYSLVTITQRQSTGADQRESVSFDCEKCGTQLFKYDYASRAPRRGHQREEMGPISVLPTVINSADAAEAFNADEAKRTCNKCGHVNPPFPLDRWGWARYRDQTRAVRDAHDSLLGVDA